MRPDIGASFIGASQSAFLRVALLNRNMVEFIVTGKSLQRPEINRQLPFRRSGTCGLPFSLNMHKFPYLWSDSGTPLILKKPGAYLDTQDRLNCLRSIFYFLYY